VALIHDKLGLAGRYFVRLRAARNGDGGEQDCRLATAGLE
jgi:hypothetical protein